MSPARRPAGFSAARTAALALAAGALVAGAAWIAHWFSPGARLARRTLALAATLELDAAPLPPLDAARRLLAVEGALAPDAVAEFAWDGDSWSVEGRREIKDLHAALLAEAPRVSLHLDGLRAVAAGRPGPDAVDTEASAGLRVSGEGSDWRGPLHVTIRWRRGEDGWRIVHAAVRAETEEGFP